MAASAATRYFDPPPWVWAAARTLGRPGCCHHVAVRRQPLARCSSPFSWRAATRTTGRSRRRLATARVRRSRAPRANRPRPRPRPVPSSRRFRPRPTPPLRPGRRRLWSTTGRSSTTRGTAATSNCSELVRPTCARLQRRDQVDPRVYNVGGHIIGGDFHVDAGRPRPDAERPWNAGGARHGQRSELNAGEFDQVRRAGNVDFLFGLAHADEASWRCDVLGRLMRLIVRLVASRHAFLRRRAARDSARGRTR